MGDLVLGDAGRGWMVTGFFTPDYAPLADALAVNLRLLDQPHHLFAVARNGDWNSQTMRKPRIVLDAMALYPGKTLVLMDVDCMVRQPLDGFLAAAPATDMSCGMAVKTKRLGRHRQRTSLSSRVIVIRPTAGAGQVMRRWEQACTERPWMHGDEPNLVLALARSPGCSFAPLDDRHSGREAGSAPADAVIVHHSARGHGSRFERALTRLKARLLGTPAVDRLAGAHR